MLHVLCQYEIEGEEALEESIHGNHLIRLIVVAPQYQDEYIEPSSYIIDPML
jgi:hypothetical protein